MAWWLVREKRVQVVMVELLETATQRLRTAFRQEHWAESVAPCLAVEKRQGPPALRRALLALLE